VVFYLISSPLTRLPNGRKVLAEHETWKGDQEQTEDQNGDREKTTEGGPGREFSVTDLMWRNEDERR
jgi:hypothetical protein